MRNTVKFKQIFVFMRFRLTESSRLRLVEGQDAPDAEPFVVEGSVSVWDVPSYFVNSRRVEGWTMIRVEGASVVKRKHDEWEPLLSKDLDHHSVDREHAG